MRLLLARVTVILGATALFGCPPKGSEKQKSSEPAACAHFGQTCEVRPGKLGTCVVRDDCTGPPSSCFVCQSQH